MSPLRSCISRSAAASSRSIPSRCCSPRAKAKARTVLTPNLGGSSSAQRGRCRASIGPAPPPPPPPAVPPPRFAGEDPLRFRRPRKRERNSGEAQRAGEQCPSPIGQREQHEQRQVDDERQSWQPGMHPRAERPRQRRLASPESEIGNLGEH